MADAELVLVRTCSNVIEAEIAQSVLLAANIEAAVHADDCGGLYPNLQMGGVGVVVRREDAQEAERLLATPAETVDVSRS